MIPNKATILSLLSLTSAAQGSANAEPWPFPLAEGDKYYPRSSNALAKREQKVIVNNNGHGAVLEDGSVKKMWGHEGEKLNFWISQGFSAIDGQSGNGTLSITVIAISGKYAPPMHADDFPVYEKSDDDTRRGIAHWLAIGRRSGLVKRDDFKCPEGASSCGSIGKPKACCQNGSKCQSVTDTGFGDVGCCQDGESCSGTLDSCFDGYTHCSGGGCCRPGYYCTDGGCAPMGGPSVPFLTTRPTVATGLDICEKSYYPCPSSLSFGCCRIGRLCGITDCPINTGPGTPGIEYLTGSPAGGGGGGGGTVTIPPPTPLASNPPSTAMMQPTDSVKQTGAAGGVITVSGGSCPTGYFSCGTEYNGGCCRTGRNCGITSCPAGTGAPATGPSCAPGYYTCPPSANGGCCPNGYACAVSNCPASSIIGPNGQIQTQAQASAAEKKAPTSDTPRSKAPELILCAGIASFLAGVLALGVLV